MNNIDTLSILIGIHDIIFCKLFINISKYSRTYRKKELKFAFIWSFRYMMVHVIFENQVQTLNWCKLQRLIDLLIDRFFAINHF